MCLVRSHWCVRKHDCHGALLCAEKKIIRNAEKKNQQQKNKNKKQNPSPQKMPILYIL